ncbi:unnamed protein product [Vitrella brassicaformis CCMP3155]|uniref:Uncharacterized protein n=1 Tax=Vitrella brassicaformis (strain CCMP3155) TaxID=1169540 RepID=A0A0G4FET3_VITBC|nr:unnamed protein product [Vitrella brassicaformis CCMP3155]|eukprot:CEM11702.1 unnamed protein product [Vitrella brassicaformis CCMP3155]
MGSSTGPGWGGSSSSSSGAPCRLQIFEIGSGGQAHRQLLPGICWHLPEVGGSLRDVSDDIAEHHIEIMSERDTQGQSRGLAASAGGGAGGGGGEEEDSVAAADGETVLMLVMPFLPLHILVPLPLRLPKSANLLWEEAAISHTRLFIDCAAKADDQYWHSPTEGRVFWQRIPSLFVKRVAARLTGLTEITLCHPPYPPRWGTDVLVSVIETTAAPPAQPDAQADASRLETIAFEKVQLSEADQPLKWQHPTFPPLAEPPTISLPSLKAVTGAAGEHGVLADRGWRVPSLERLEQQRWRADQLGRFISSSRSLQHVGGSLSDDGWASVFERMPEAAAGQPGPLARLQSIGTIELRDNPEAAREAIARLQVALASRGSRRSLTQLSAAMSFYRFDSSVLPLMQSLESLHKTCCRADAPVVFEGRWVTNFDLSLFYSDDLPANPSPLFRKAMQAAAQGADWVGYVISEHNLTDPVDSPSKAAIDVVESLTFKRVTTVAVRNAMAFVPPPNIPSPRPTIINHLQQFPRIAGLLYIGSHLGGESGRLLAQKMPTELRNVEFGSAVSAQDRKAVLEGLGKGGKLTDGPFDGWSSDSFPLIHTIEMPLWVFDELDPSAAAKTIRKGISSVVGAVRGLECFSVRVQGDGAVHDALGQLLPTGTMTGSKTPGQAKKEQPHYLQPTKSSLAKVQQAKKKGTMIGYSFTIDAEDLGWQIEVTARRLS